MQWMDSVLSQGKEVDFFYDEHRCPIYVKDMVHTISSLTNMWISGMYLLMILFTWCTYSDPAKPEKIMCNHTSYKTFSMIYLAHFTGCIWYISDFAGIHKKPFIFLTLFYDMLI